MNKEVITVGDVYRVENSKWLAVIISKDPNFDVNGMFNILFSDGDISTRDKNGFFLTKFHKIGHIEKFAEALEELQEMAKNVER
jgi:hypothetical protein